MADLELRCRYKTLPNKIGLGVMAALFPVWALMVPTCLGLMAKLLFDHPVNSDTALWLLIWLASIPVLSVLLTAYFEDDRISISKDGISFPLFMMWRLWFRRSRSWSELKSATVKRTLGSSGKECLVLKFNSGESLGLKTNNFTGADLEQMLLATEMWGSEYTRTPELVDFQYQLQNENRGLGKANYRQMWEEELSRRFNATSFVPLEPDHMLRGGQLRIIRQIAFGGLSAIYLAQRNNVDMVVLKEAVVPGSADPETRAKAEELFQREAMLLLGLDHGHIAKVLGHFVDDGRNYLMLEYINGQDLRQYIKENGAQSEEQVLAWAIQIADILRYLHGQNPPVIHRDLTPDNLVLKNDGTIMLIDFGAANQFVGTATGTLVGKQAYIAPEQLRGKADLSSDLYSFGGTLHFLLTGRDPVPLAESHPAELQTQISSELDELIAALTAFDKEQRINDAGQLMERLLSLTGKPQPIKLKGKDAFLVE